MLRALKLGPLTLCLMVSTACSLLCSNNAVTDVRYIKQELPPQPTSPVYFEVKFTACKEKLYCLDEHNAKNLEKNFAIDKAFQKQVDAVWHKDDTK